MSPRRSAADARATRAAILGHALDLGSTEGLESLSFGRLADAAALSKSGVIRHFASKEELQLAVLDAGARVFRAEVWDPVADVPAGLARLRAAMAAWLAYLGDCPLPGGCLVTAAASEFDGRAGPVRDAIVADGTQWRTVLERDAEVAVRAGELPADTDPAQLAFELTALALAVNQATQLYDDRAAPARGLKAVERLLGAA